MFLINSEPVISDGLNATLEKILDDRHSEQWFRLYLLLDGDLLSAQVNRKVWQLYDGSFGIPISALKFLANLYDDLASHRQVSIVPCSPQATTIQLHIQLVVANSGDLAERSEL